MSDTTATAAKPAAADGPVKKAVKRVKKAVTDATAPKPAAKAGKAAPAAKAEKAPKAEAVKDAPRADQVVDPAAARLRADTAARAAKRAQDEADVLAEEAKVREAEAAAAEKASGKPKPAAVKGGFTVLHSITHGKADGSKVEFKPGDVFAPGEDVDTASLVAAGYLAPGTGDAAKEQLADSHQQREEAAAKTQAPPA